MAALTTTFYASNVSFNITTLSYTELSKKDWRKIIMYCLIAGIISLLFIYILSLVWKIQKCYNVGLFLVSFFIILLIIGDEFIKNISTFIIGTSLLAIILTIFIFIGADLANCRPE
jgi:hypothetical protein